MCLPQNIWGARAAERGAAQLRPGARPCTASPSPLAQVRGGDLTWPLSLRGAWRGPVVLAVVHDLSAPAPGGPSREAETGQQAGGSHVGSVPALWVVVTGPARGCAQIGEWAAPAAGPRALADQRRRAV